MTKTSKKILLVLLLVVLTVFAFNVKVFAYVSNKDDAIKWFKDSNNFKDKTVFVWQRFAAITNNYNVIYNLKPTSKSSNTSIVDFEANSTNYLIAKKEGTVTITATCVNDTETLTQSYKVTVVKPKDSKLQSKTNDVVSIVPDYKNQKNKVLLANGELWNLNSNTNKLENKETGNVKKYVYGSVYFREGKNTKWTDAIHTLKNNGKLTTKTDLGKLTAKNVVDVTTYGYLNSKGKYYAIIQKNDKVSYKLKAKNAEAILGEALLKKSDGLYTIDDVKIVKAKIKDAIGSATSGMYLDNKNVLYKYTYEEKSKKYKTEKIEKNVKEILNWGVYKTKKNKIKTTYKDYPYYDCKFYNGTLKIKYNGKVYLGDNLIATNVEDFGYSTSVNGTLYLIKKDGSIWVLNLGDNSYLKQVRSGKNSAKGLSAPTKVKAKKKSKKAKVTWKKVDGAKKYTVYRATKKNGKYSKVGTTKGSSYTDKTVKKGKKYFYKVVANGSEKLFNSKKSEAAKVKI